MTRHRTDPFALLFGLAFALAGVVLLATQFTDTTPGPRWTVAAGLILLGSVTLIATVASGMRARTDAPAVAAPSFEAPSPDPSPSEPSAAPAAGPEPDESER